MTLQELDDAIADLRHLGKALDATMRRAHDMRMPGNLYFVQLSIMRNDVAERLVGYMRQRKELKK